MIRAKRSLRKVSEREALCKRVNRMHECFNKEAWAKCFSLLDPRLRKQKKVEQQPYVQCLRRFRGVYGKLQPWYIRVSLHLDGSANKHDPRPFAYVYVVWQDQNHEFHMFRERWVRDSGRWFSRVVGLVPNRNSSDTARD